MIVKIQVSKLQEILDLVSRFVSKHSTLPVLENIYIKGNIDTLLFRATDMEKYIEIELPAEIQSEWAITVNSRTFTDIIKTIDDESVELVIDDSTDILKIKTINDEFTIKWIPANEYVAVPEVVGGTNVEISANYFSKWISKVEYSVTERNFSPVLTWILMRLKKTEDGNNLVFVWTDSFRLAEYKIELEWETKDINIIIPKLNIWDIKKVSDFYVDKWGENLKITFSDNLVSFNMQLDDIKILATSLLIQWNFPDYDNENIIPRNYNTQVIVDKDALEKAIRKISILTKDLNNFIDIAVLENNITITSWETDKWDAKTIIPAIVKWESLNFWVNGKYLQDFVRSIDSVEVMLDIVNSEKPIVLKDKWDKNYTYVVRPLVK